MTIFNIMNSLMKRHVGLLMLSLLIGLLTILSNVGMLSVSSVLISRAALHPKVSDLMVLIVAVRFFGISRGVLRYVERLFSHDATFKLLSSLRKSFFKNFNENYSENNKQFKTGEIYTKIANDVDSLKEFYLRGVYPVIIAVLTGIATSALIFYFSRILSVVYALIYLFCGFALPITLFVFKSKLIKREAELKKEINLILLDIFNGILEIEVYALREDFIIKFNKLSKELSRIRKEKNFITTIGESAHGFFASILIAAILVISLPLVEQGKLQGIYYAMLPLSAMASFEALIPMSNILYKFSEAYNSGISISSIMKSRDGSYGTGKGEITSYNISMKDLSVKKIDTEDFIIKDISFELPYGKKLAIVGASGSGKSTILKVLMGFIKFHKGEIKIGDSSYSYLEMEDMRRLFAYVDQNPYVFNTTIRENLLIANSKVEENKLLMAIEKAQITNLIKELPEGLDTMLGQNGSNISGGERQRLVISRALLKESKIVLLDEPTASLDTRLERQIIDSIHEFVKDKSCIWVTHRLIDMDRMDEILVFHKGSVVERGTHDELLNKRGRYFKLWSIQQQCLN